MESDSGSQIPDSEESSARPASRKMTAARILSLVLLTLVLALLGTGVSVFMFFRSLPPDQLVVGALTDGYPLPSSLFWTYLEHHASIPEDYRTETGQTLLQFALAAYETEDPRTHAPVRRMLTLLLKRGADPNASSRQTGLRPLHDAVLYASTELVEFLLDHGANPRLTATEGRFQGATPLQFAYHLGNRAGHDRTELIVLLEARTPPAP